MNAIAPEHGIEGLLHGGATLWRLSVRDMPPIAHVQHVALVTAASVSAAAGAMYGGDALREWLGDAMLVTVVPWLISILVLHLALFERLYNDEKRDRDEAEYRKTQEREREADRERIRVLEAVLKKAGML